MKLKYYFVFFAVLVFLGISVHCVAMEATKEQRFLMEKDSSKYKITIDMPRENHEKLNSILKDKIEELRKEFLETVSKSDTALDMQYTLDISYQRYLFETYISYYFQITTDTGGAHPNTTLFTVVFDTKSEEIVSLKESDLPVISKEIRGNLLMNPKMVRTDFMMSGTEPRIENFKYFVFTENGILFFFPPYQVGPYSSGIFESLVSYEKLL